LQLVLGERKGAIDGSTVAEHTPNQLKVKGLSPATAAGTWRKKMAKKYDKNEPMVVAQWYAHSPNSS
jgi:hypothetical protein